MRYVREPTEKERQELERMIQQEVGRVAVRAHMVLLSSREFTIPEISNIYQISDTTIYNWFNRFDQEGPPGLYDQPRSGRPPKMDEEAKGYPSVSSMNDYPFLLADRQAENLMKKPDELLKEPDESSAKQSE